MGAYNGAEVAELTGLYILEKIQKFINPKNIGLYRGDGLAAVQHIGSISAKMKTAKIYNVFFKR